jgi:hypothetical protein
MEPSASGGKRIGSHDLPLADGKKQRLEISGQVLAVAGD